MKMFRRSTVKLPRQKTRTSNRQGGSRYQGVNPYQSARAVQDADKEHPLAFVGPRMGIKPTPPDYQSGVLSLHHFGDNQKTLARKFQLLKKDGVAWSRTRTVRSDYLFRLARCIQGQVSKKGLPSDKAPRHKFADKETPDGDYRWQDNRQTVARKRCRLESNQREPFPVGPAKRASV